MKYPTLIIGLLAASVLLPACNGQKSDKEKELAELRQLAELDRREMENQYAEYAAQYGEMKKTIKDDTLQARLNAEQLRAERLLAELKNTKATSSAEILRLKKELATVRAVLRDYIRQVDSLQQKNIRLTSERDAARADAALSHQQNEALTTSNQQLKETVEVAAQLNATSISVTPIKKNGKPAKNTKDIKNFVINFNIARNVTAKTGNRTVYVRLLKPSQNVLGVSGSFKYENKNIQFSASRQVEYTGQDTHVSIYVPANEYLEPGTYSAYIFCDDQMIGSSNVTMNK